MVGAGFKIHIERCSGDVFGSTSNSISFGVRRAVSMTPPFGNDSSVFDNNATYAGIRADVTTAPQGKQQCPFHSLFICHANALVLI